MKLSGPSRPGPHRRSVMLGGAALLVTAGLGPIGCASAPRGRFRDDPFTLGVASGDPLPDGIVLWTRLAPAPLAEDGGMPAAPAPVRWEIAEDERFARIVQAGTVTAMPAAAHTVHVEVSGLAPAHTYYYRFISGGVASETGRTRTAPAPGASVARMRIAHVGCQNYEAGDYTAYRHVAEEDVDLVVHTGDYIYEGARKFRPELVRAHPDHACKTLADYRLRYALYKSDPDLRAAHAAHPFAVVFDDHEVSNNWAGTVNGHGHGGPHFMARRAAGFQAWYEHMPVRRAQRPNGPYIRIYRTLDYGGLIHMQMCDTRQYRTPQPCGGHTAPRCPGDSDPHAAMMSAAEEQWLRDGLHRSQARWNVIAQQVLMAELDRDTDPDVKRYAMDKWDGYRVPRRRLLQYLADASIPNAVVLTGDIHRHIAAVLRPDFSRPETPAVAVELVNTSISSNGDGNPHDRRDRIWPQQNPDIVFVGSQRGYVRHTVTQAAWHTDFRVLDKVTVRGMPAYTRASYVVEPGRAALLTA